MKKSSIQKMRTERNDDDDDDAVNGVEWDVYSTLRKCIKRVVESLYYRVSHCEERKIFHLVESRHMREPEKR